MTNLCCEVLEKLKGKTLVTAESLTGGGIGAALTAVPGSSEVYKGGVICYTNWVKEHVLGVPAEILERYGAVSTWTAGYMSSGVRKLRRFARYQSGQLFLAASRAARPPANACAGWMRIVAPLGMARYRFLVLLINYVVL